MDKIISSIHLVLDQHKTSLCTTEKEILHAKIYFLGNGENNLMYRIETDTQSYVLRAAFRPELEESLMCEYELLSHIPNGLGPKPLVLDVSKKEIPHVFMIQSFIPGSSISKWDKHLLTSHANKMSTLHHFQKETQRDGIDIKAIFAEKIALRKNDPNIFSHEIQETVDKIITFVADRAKYFFDIKMLSRIHGDLHKGNILVKEQEVFYVDWEESRMGDPAIDVAGLFLSSDLETELAAFYIKSYEQKASMQDIEKRIPVWLLYKELSFLLHKKWESLDPSRSIHGAKNNSQEEIAGSLKKIEKFLHFSSEITSK